MKVIATKPGFDGQQLRQPGDAFEVSNEQFTEVWMERAPADTEIPAVKPIEFDEFGNPIIRPISDVLKEYQRTPARPIKKGKA